MSLQRLMQQQSNGTLEDYCMGPAYDPFAAPMGSPQIDNKRIQMLADTVATLPRGRKQLAVTRSSSLGDCTWPQRRLVTVEKQDNGTFGFEIQTYIQQLYNPCSSEIYTFICKVQEESPAHSSGLQMGDILANINGVNLEGFSHKQVVDLIKAAGNRLRLETVNGTAILRRSELEIKLRALKQTLRDKWVEFRSLQLQEQRLLHGDEATCPSLESEDSYLPGSPALVDPAYLIRNRFSSTSSCKSWMSSMTVDSEESFQTCVSEDSGREPVSRQTSTDDECFLSKDSELALRKSSLRRNRSISTASSSSMSPLWEGGGNLSSVFGTLPRKSRRGSVRKQLLRFIPGLHRAVEEEESRF
ncbi:cytohesin-interacting protein [Ornithorhynchus anatinus]|uniref:Cytohesin 1 interacting protein n=1 Tax=Ornithorhynchus anatinus TaxID=9258 RepID=F6WTB7_ORNAN|nr:cytohesin-interacting protein [Ornithorhynchus anatinus]